MKNAPSCMCFFFLLQKHVSGGFVKDKLFLDASVSVCVCALPPKMTWCPIHGEF